MSGSAILFLLHGLTLTTWLHKQYCTCILHTSLLYKYGQNVKQLCKFLYMSFATLTRHYSYNYVLVA